MQFKQNRETDIVTENVMFSRYLSTQKLLSFLFEKNMLFTRLDIFEDIIEGMTMKNIAEYEIYGPITNPNFPNLEASNESHKRVREKIERETINSQKSQYVSCWFTDDWESKAMWDIYSSTDGILIKIKGSKLFNLIKLNLSDLVDDAWQVFSYGFCEYRKLTPFDYRQHKANDTFNSYKKDSCYKHENEFRFVAHRHNGFDDENLKVFSINIKEIINDFEIIFHPKMESWKKENIKKILVELNLEIKCNDSKIRLR
ncbi:MAG: hypothetical protein V4547_01765 [Bacteroidota bacterium]